MKLAVLSDFLEERWPSMDLVSEMLVEYASRLPGVEASSVRPRLPRRLADAVAASEPFKRPMALAIGKHLAVSDAGNAARVRGHDDGTCDNGARDGTPSDFINAGDHPACAPQRALEWVEALTRRHRAAYASPVGAATLRSRMREAFAPTTLRR